MAIRKKFIGLNSVDGERLLIDNNEALRAKDSGGAAQELLKLDASDVLKILKLPEVDSSLPAISGAKQLTTKEYVDSQISSTGGDVSALELRVEAIEDDYGASGGLATLDGAGKIPLQQLPNAVLTYEGVWDASTNTPSLANGAGNADEDIGHVYRVSVAGSVNFGAGAISFEVGDYVILNSSKIWEKSDTTDTVASVNGYQGVVVLATTDVAEAGDSRYYTAARESAMEAYADQAEADAITSANSYTDGAVGAEQAARELEDATFLKLDGSRSMTNLLDMGGFLVSQVAPAVDPTDAVIKSQLDAVESAIDGRLDILEGSATTEGSVAKAEQDAKDYADGIVAIEEAARIANDAATLASANGYTDAEIVELDSAIQSQLDGLVVPVQAYQSFSLSAGDISNGYITLPSDLIGTPWLMVDGVMGRPVVDFTVAGEQINFVNDFAVGGQSALEAGDVLHLYWMTPSYPFNP